MNILSIEQINDNNISFFSRISNNKDYMYNNNLDIFSFNNNINSESNRDLSSIHISALGQSNSESYDENLLSIKNSTISNAYSQNNEGNINLNETISNNIQNKNLFKVKYMKRIRRKNKRNFTRKYNKDNIIRKIKVDYTKSIIDLMNQILEKSLINNNKYLNLKFYYLEYDYSKNITKDCLDNLKNLTIENVIISNISRKYKNKISNSNEETCNIIKKEKELKNIADILKKNFLFFFENIYVKKRKSKYNLKELGLIDLEIDLSKIRLFEDLLSKNKKKNNKEYIKKMEFYKKLMLNSFKNPYKFKIHKVH